MAARNGLTRRRADNAVVLDDRVLNADGPALRRRVRQTQGARCDRRLYLLGYPLLAHFEAHKSGTPLNNQLARVRCLTPRTPGNWSASTRRTRRRSPFLWLAARRRPDPSACLSSARVAVIVVIAVIGGVVPTCFSGTKICAFFWRGLPLFADRCAARFALMVLERVAGHSL